MYFVCTEVVSGAVVLKTSVFIHTPHYHCPISIGLTGLWRVWFFEVPNKSTLLTEMHVLNPFISELRSKNISHDVLSSARDEYFCIVWKIDNNLREYFTVSARCLKSVSSKASITITTGEVGFDFDATWMVLTNSPLAWSMEMSSFIKSSWSLRVSWTA